MVAEIKIVRGCEFPEGKGQLQISFNGEKYAFDVNGTKDILRSLCEAAAQDINFEQKISSCEDINFIEPLETIEKEDRARGFAFPKVNEKWFVDYTYFLTMQKSYGKRYLTDACYSIIETLLDNAVVMFIAADAPQTEVDLSIQNRCLGVVYANSLQNVVDSSPSGRVSVNGGSLQNDLPPQNKDDQTILGQLDSAVYARVVAGESALQIALSDNLLEDCNGDWYPSCLNLLRNRIQKRQIWESVDGVLGATKYASKILWFRTVALSDSFDGSNHIAPFRDAISQDDVNRCVYDALRRFAPRGDIKKLEKETGSFPFGVTEKPEVPFTVYVWFPCGKKGLTSRLVWGLKQVIENCRNDLDNGLDPDTYHDDERLTHIEKLLRYETVDPWHRGGDFVRFIRWIVERDGGANADASENWMDHITQSPNFSHVNANERVSARVGEYLRWQHPQNEYAQSYIKRIVGIDKVVGADRLSYGFDDEQGDREISLPPALSIEFDSEKRHFNYRIHGTNRDLKIGLNLNRICGIYEPVVETSADRRFSWWKKIGCGLVDDDRTTYDGHLSASSKHVLVVLESETNGQFPAGFMQVGCWQAKLDDCDYQLHLLEVTCREMVDRKVSLFGFDVIVSAAIPKITIDDEAGLRTWDNRSLPICGSNAQVSLDDFANGGVVSWVIDARTLGNMSQFQLQNVSLGEVHRVTACINGGRRKTKSVFVLPNGVIESIRTGTLYDDGEWKVERCPMSIAAIVSALKDRLEVWRVSHSGECCVDVARTAEGMPWWIENFNGEILSEGVCRSVSLNPFENWTDKYLAFPEWCPPDDIVARCSKATEGDEVGAVTPEYHDGCVRYRLTDLLDVDHDRATGVYRYSPNYVGARGGLSFSGQMVCEYSFQPQRRTIVKDQNGRLGVYVPTLREEISCEVAAFTDNCEARFFDGKRVVAVAISAGNNFTFIPNDFINGLLAEDTLGEIFIGVKRCEDAPSVSADLEYIDDEKWGVFKLRQAHAGYGVQGRLIRHLNRQKQRIDGLSLNCVWKRQSRLYELYSRCSSDWWFARGNNLQCVEGGKNKCDDFFCDDGIDQIYYCRPKACLTGLSDAQERLCREDNQQMVRFLSLRDMILSSRERNECHYDATSGSTNGGWRSARLRTYEDDAEGAVICNVDLAAGLPLLCRDREGDRWGVFFPEDWLPDRAVRICVYTDIADTPNRSIKTWTVTRFENAYLSIDESIRSVKEQFPTGELFVALFWNYQDQDDLPMESACCVRNAQLVRINNVAALYTPNEAQRNVAESLRNNDDVKGHPALAYSRIMNWRPVDVKEIAGRWIDVFQLIGYAPDHLEADQVANLIVEGLRNGFNFLLETVSFRLLSGFVDIPDRVRAIFVDRVSGNGVPWVEDGAGICPAMFALQSIESGVPWPMIEQCFDVNRCQICALGITGVFRIGYLDERLRLIGVGRNEVSFERDRRLLRGQENGRVRFPNNNAFLRFELDERQFISAKLELFRRWMRVPNVRWAQNDDLEAVISLTAIDAVFNDVMVPQQNDGMAVFSLKMLKSWASAFPHEEPVYRKTIVQTALICAAHLTRSFSGNEMGVLVRGSGNYNAVSQVVYWSFVNMRRGNKEPWRLLMWVLTSALGLLHFVNFKEVE